MVNYYNRNRLNIRSTFPFSDLSIALFAGLDGWMHRKIQWSSNRVLSLCFSLFQNIFLLVEAEYNAHFAAYDTLLRESDVIVICTPLTPATHHMIGAAQFDKMKKGVVVINIARGAIIDEAALVKALESGKVSAKR